MLTNSCLTFRLDCPSLLSPIGAHRSALAAAQPPRKQKRNKTPAAVAAVTTPAATAVATPAPEISAHVLVGINETSRHLESLISPAAAAAAAAAPSSRILAIFTLHSPTSPLISHLPALCTLATPHPALVSLPASAAPRLAAALALPRVGVFALLATAKLPDTLASLIANIPKVMVPWLENRGVPVPSKVKTVMSRGDPAKAIKKAGKKAEKAEKKANRGTKRVAAEEAS